MSVSLNYAKAERTDWYRWPIRPARVGWYEVRGYSVDDVGMLLFWNGKQWGYWAPSMYPGHDAWVYWADDTRDSWRGLKEPA